MSTPSVIEQILELARWAPSGDNVQSHEFEILAPDHVLVHARDTRADTVYDLDGHPSQIAFGALLETIAIAATAHGLRTDVVRRPQVAEDPAAMQFDVRFVAAPGIQADPLIAAIPRRSVQRRRLSTRPLTVAEKAALTAAVGAAYELRWLESGADKWRAARLMYHNAELRLTMPEAYAVHRRIIHWGVARSPDRVPDRALGVDAVTLRLMKWAMASWKRLATMNALMGTWAPRLQMDLLPGLACAAHFVMQSRQAPVTVDDYVAAGRAVQRFWLTATELGLQMQPEMTPLIFSRYVVAGRRFTAERKLDALAARLQRESAALLTGPAHPLFMGRLGAGRAAAARSERKPLAQLIRR